MVATEAEVEVMTVERNGPDLVFTLRSLSSAGTSDGKNIRIRQREEDGLRKTKRRKTGTLKV